MNKFYTDKTLVVGDVHIGPNQNLRRADWLGRFIKDIEPDRIVFIGDLLTFDSLSAWDKDKRRKMEMRRYEKDIKAGEEFLERMEAEAGEKLPTEIILTEGNHEFREERYIDYNPELEGSLNYKASLSLCADRDDSGRQSANSREPSGGNSRNIRGWQTVPYREFFKYKGISFTHVPIMESGRPVQGKYATNRALDICDSSVVFGHTHKLDYASAHPHGRVHLKEALNVGCYFEHIDEYAKGSVTSYWRGLILLDHHKHGRFRFETYPIGQLRRMYGGGSK